MNMHGTSSGLYTLFTLDSDAVPLDTSTIEPLTLLDQCTDHWYQASTYVVVRGGQPCLPYPASSWTFAYIMSTTSLNWHPEMKGGINEVQPSNVVSHPHDGVDQDTDIHRWCNR